MDNIKQSPTDAPATTVGQLTESKDRRDFNRMRTHGNVMLRVKTPPGMIYDAQLVDVSASGINITLEEPINIGTEIQLAVKLQDHNELFFVSGIVARASAATSGDADEKYQIGVELRYEKNNPDFHDWRALFIA